MYPRELTSFEEALLFYVLPEDRKGYAEYRNLIRGMLVIGEGRFGAGNYVLGYKSDKPDLSYPSLPMFACGQIVYEEAKVQISIHEFFDNKIEFSVNNLTGEDIPESLNEKKRWSYSYWMPGKPSPFDNDKLHTYELSTEKAQLVLAISESNHSIWLYDSASGVNHIIPVTNFINELLRGDKRVNKTKGIDMNYIFSNLQMFREEDFKRAFIEYNKHWKKLELKEPAFFYPRRKKSFFPKLFKRTK